ncbi:VanZ family protein [Streptomyces europaeiscabiei]|uniref:VanZ family protein n=1 Tax=Streptomyces europaeiscabiei TaxID=146819 RepID=UPI002E288E24|nr:VanZ family protein [Streptomyces europaeiscabiei]
MRREKYMFSASFSEHYVFLAGLGSAAFAVGVAAWRIATHLGNRNGIWWFALTTTLIGVLGVASFGGGRASGQCSIDHELSEPFHTAQGLLALAMFVPVGIFSVLALRRIFPSLAIVALLPCVIELSQALVPHIGRACASSEAEMNIVGGLAGLSAATLAMVIRGKVSWAGWARPTAIVALVIAAGGIVAFRAAVTPFHVDGAGLSASDKQAQAVNAAMHEAFGDHYSIGEIQLQPCVGAPCSNLLFVVDGGGSGTLAWPHKDHLNVLLEESSIPGPSSFPVADSQAPQDGDDAYRIADSYMRDHFPWASKATIHRSYPVGEKAEFGWMVSWRFRDGDVLMPRMLDVEINRAGRVSQVDITRGPTSIDTPPIAVGKKGAEKRALKFLQKKASRNENFINGLKGEAFVLKAVKRESSWHPNWIVQVGVGAESGEMQEGDETARNLWVDAINGKVYDNPY